MVWLWLSCGVILILSEFVIPGFVICFFGAAAIAVSGLLWLFPDLSLVWQLLFFALIGVALLFLSRRLLPDVFRGTADAGTGDIDLDEIAGSRAVCREEILPGRTGKVEFRGSLWNADSETPIAPGDICLVRRRENLILIVEKIETNQL